MEFAAHFDNKSFEKEDSAFQLPQSVQLSFKFPLLIVPINTEKFAPKCVKILQNKATPSDFKVILTVGSSRISTESGTGRIIVECDLPIEIWDQKTGKKTEYYQWIAVIAQEKKIDGGGKERDWNNRTAHTKTGESTWKFEEYDIKALIEGYSKVLTFFAIQVFIALTILN